MLPVLLEPEIPENLGSIIRLAACFSSHVGIIEPCSFILDPKLLKRSAMDYLEKTTLLQYFDFQHFKQNHKGRIIATSAGNYKDYSSFEFLPSDAILFGKESSGISPEIMEQCDEIITIPISDQTRSLNLAMSCAIIMSRAHLQIHKLFTGSRLHH